MRDASPRCRRPVRLLAHSRRHPEPAGSESARSALAQPHQQSWDTESYLPEAMRSRPEPLRPRISHARLVGHSPAAAVTYQTVLVPVRRLLLFVVAFLAVAVASPRVAGRPAARRHPGPGHGRRRRSNRECQRHRDLGRRWREPHRPHRSERPLHHHLPRRRGRLLHHRHLDRLSAEAVRGAAHGRPGHPRRRRAAVAHGHARHGARRGRARAGQPQRPHARRRAAPSSRRAAPPSPPISRAISTPWRRRSPASRRSPAPMAIPPASPCSASRPIRTARRSTARTSAARRLPRDAQVSTSLVTSPYDVSRGDFSGGQLNVRSGRGSNFIRRSNSLNFDAPALQWTDPAARALGQQYTNLSLGGSRLRPDRVRQGVLQRRVPARAPAERSADAAQHRSHRLRGDRRLGRFRRAAARHRAGAGIPLTSGATPANRLNDQGSLFGSFDFTPPTRQQRQTFNLVLNGNWNRQTPAGQLTTELPAHSGDRTNWGAGVQRQHTTYFGRSCSARPRSASAATATTATRTRCCRTAACS